MKEKIAMWYKHGLWSKTQVANAVRKGVITAADYLDITGEMYTDA